jgi:serine/threonine protein kinase
MVMAKLDELFNAARRIEAPDARRAYLERACGDDMALKARVERLLRVHEEEPTFLEAPAVPKTARTVAIVREGPGTQIGVYKLVELIGEGGFGVVYRAEQQQPMRRSVALKILKPGMDSRPVVARFEVERQALALMDHPNIARVLDGGETASGRPYFVMELVKGVPITRYCDEQQLTPHERLGLFVSVCGAVQHAHQKGIIHRDLKPSNVLIAVYDDRAVPKVIDFGVAKATGPKLTEETLVTEVGSVIGTVEYMSPEQAEPDQSDIDTRGDIYSLGVLLYELLTGTTPLRPQRLRGAGVLELLCMIREEEPPTPSTRLGATAELPAIAASRGLEPKKLRGLVRGDLDWIVMKCLEKDRTRRYETANALARDIERYLNEEPVEASPPSAGYRLRKFARKNRKLLAVAAGFTLLLVAGTIVSTWEAWRATLAEQATSRERDRVLAEKERADQQANIAQAVNDFLQQDLLGQADIGNQPLRGGVDRNRDIKVGELLDRAAGATEGKFLDQPLTEAAIRLTLGKTYQGLGRFEEAQPHLERSILLRTVHLGADHPDTLSSKSALAWQYHHQGKYDLAEPLLVEVLQELTAQLGADHPNTMTSKRNLASLYMDQGKYKRAEPLYLEVVQAQTSKLGADHPNTLRSKNGLALLYHLEGKFDRSELLYLEVIEARRSKLGIDHPNTLGSKSGLAGLYLHRGKYDLAEPLYQEVIQTQASKLGANHPDTLRTKSGLALLYYYQTKYDRAEPLYQEVIDGLTSKLGADHPDILSNKKQLAMLYGQQEKYDRAVAIYQEVIHAETSKLGADHPNILRSKNNLATLYVQQEKIDLAEPLYQEVIQGQTSKLGADHPNTLNTKNNLARIYHHERKFAEAEPLYHEVIRGQTSKLGADHPDTLNTKNNLAELYRDDEKYDRAEPLFREVVEGARSRLGLAHAETQTYFRNLCACHEQMEQPARAEPLWRELAAFLKQRAGADSPAYAHELAALGRNLLQQKRFIEAEPLLRESLASGEQKEAGTWTMFHARSLLGGSLLGQQKFAEAEPLLRQGYEGMKEHEAQTPEGAKARLTEALERIVQLYDAWGKPDKAAEWRKKLEVRKAM